MDAEPRLFLDAARERAGNENHLAYSADKSVVLKLSSSVPTEAGTGHEYITGQMFMWPSKRRWTALTKPRGPVIIMSPPGEG